LDLIGGNIRYNVAETAHALVTARTGADPASFLANLPTVADGVAGMRMIAAAAASNQDDRRSRLA
jgi:hypothetical protein